MPWFDVHYSINGHLKIEAKSAEEVNAKTDVMLENVSLCVEEVLKAHCETITDNTEKEIIN